MESFDGDTYGQLAERGEDCRGIEYFTVDRAGVDNQRQARFNEARFQASSATIRNREIDCKGNDRGCR